MKIKELKSIAIIKAEREYLIEQMYKIYTSKLFPTLPNEIKQNVLDALLKVAEKN